MTTDVSVVVCTLGRRLELARCVEALVRGTARPAEIIVVDQTGDEHPGRLAGATTYLRVPDEGVSRARNRGAAVAASGVLAFTDDDCVPSRGWIAAISRAYGGSEVIDGVTGRVLPLADGPPGVAVSSRTSAVRRTFQGPDSLPWEIGTGGNLSLRRAAFERLGGFDETLGPGTNGRAAEDVDLLYRAAVSGLTLLYEPDAVVYHERKSRRARLDGRFAYGYGMGAFASRHAGEATPQARSLRRRYARVLARAALAGARRGDPWPLVEGVLTGAGIAAASSPLARR